MRVKTTVGQVAWVGGIRYDQSSNVLVDECLSRFAKGRKRGSLYIVVEVTGPATGRDILVQQLLQGMRDAY